MSSESTPILGLPYILPSQAQKHVSHNDSIRALDALVQLSVVNRSLNAPPVTIEEGERYIIAANASGAWSDQEDKIAAFQDGAWMFYTPKPGWHCWIADEHKQVLWDGQLWLDIESGGTSSGNTIFGINTIADTTNRLAVKSDAVLFSHDDITPGSGDIRVTFNKADIGNTTSLLFQDDWSGRAEIGLSGGDDLSFKVSSNGNDWVEAISVDKSAGALIIHNYVADQLYIAGATPTLRLQDRGGGTQGDLVAEYNPDFGNGIRWGHVGWSTQEFDETTNPPALTGQKLGLGWDARNAKSPYFVDRYGTESSILTRENAVLASYKVASLPSASRKGAGALIFVSNEAGGAVPAFSDGTNWRRMSDRAIVS